MSGAGTAVSGLICTLPRSGSWLLSEHLFNTGLAGMPEEFFRRDYLGWYRDQWGVTEPVPIDEYIRVCRRETTSADTGIFTAKLHWYQMEWLTRELGTNRSACRFGELFGDVRYVHLVRRDRVRQALSWHRAIRSNVWFDVGDSAPPFTGAPDLQQVRWLEDVLDDHNSCWGAFFHAAGVAPHVVDFTDLTERPAETIRAVLAHLGVEGPSLDEPTCGRLVKQSDGWTDRWERAYLQVRDALPRRDEQIRWSQRDNRFVRSAAQR